MKLTDTSCTCHMLGPVVVHYYKLTLNFNNYQVVDLFNLADV